MLNLRDKSWKEPAYEFIGTENGIIAEDTVLATWVNCLDDGYRKSYIFAGFANSNEFGVLCESYGITRGEVEVPEQ